MYKKLHWKSFETHEEQTEYGRQLFLDMSPSQRLERFFELLALRLELLPPPKTPLQSRYILRK